jgi:hypothetical protein
VPARAVATELRLDRVGRPTEKEIGSTIPRRSDPNRRVDFERRDEIVDLDERDVGRQNQKPRCSSVGRGRSPCDDRMVQAFIRIIDKRAPVVLGELRRSRIRCDNPAMVPPRGGGEDIREHEQPEAMSLLGGYLGREPRLCLVQSLDRYQNRVHSIKRVGAYAAPILTG